MYDYDLQSLMRYRLDMRECRSRLRQGSRSFHAASLLLPAEYRSPITALYAFCRVADDEIDRADSTARALHSLDCRLERIYAGRPADCAVERSFSDVVHRYGVPRTLPEAMLEGFDWDLGGKRYHSMSDVYAYSARVAGTVGVMMAILMGVRDEDNLSRACDLGVAMQLTNIARDVGEDARAGRLYLPAELLADRGVDARGWLREPEFNRGVAHAVREVLAEADRLYRRAEWGIARLPLRCRPAMFAARLIYAEIGRVIRDNGWDSVNRRAVVSGPRKAGLLARAGQATIAGCRPGDAPSLTEVRFLIDAVANA